MTKGNNSVSNEHDILFHYTTQAGLEGILNSQSLHATHYKYLNDQSELAQLAPKLRIAIRPLVLDFAANLAARNSKFKKEIVDQGKNDEFVDKEVATMIETLHSVTLGAGGRRKFHEPYIVAFCSHSDEYERSNGLLSQWRAYGGSGGYALVFDTKGLEEALVAETDRYFYSSVVLGDVVYDGDEKTFQDEFDNLPDLIWQKMEKILLRKEEPLDELFARFTRAVSRYKHRGFREEKEVRAVLSPMRGEDIGDFRKESPSEFAKSKHKKKKEPKFKDGLVPYIEVAGGDRTKLPISRIVVGPHADKDARKARLDRFLELTKLPIETSVSETPLA